MNSQEKSRKYKPQTACVVPWQQIEAYYQDLISSGLHLQSMLSLVQFIKNSGLDKRLFAYTSMHKLVVTIYEIPEWNREALHIELNYLTKKIHFEYRPEPYASIEAKRCCTEEDTITKFNQYINWLKW